MPIQPFVSVGDAPTRPPRLRRSVLVVPGSSPDMLAKAAQRGADELIFDLEDAVAPDRKSEARQTVIEALHTHDFGDTVLGVRVNDATTPFMYADIVALLGGAGGRFDCLIVPKLDHPGQLWFVEHLCTQVEAARGLERRHGLEVQVESGAGSVNLLDAVRVTDRVESVVFGPGDYAANIGVPQLDVGMPDPDYPGYQWASVVGRLVDAARSVGADAVDGPYSDFGDPEGFRRMATRARLLGMDGKWCIHPAQIELANETFTPTPEQFAAATALLIAYGEATAEGRGAATYGGRMIDEASRKMAAKLVARGRAAGLDD